MLREPRRLIASIIAIAVGVAFAAATFFLSASLEKSINSQVAGPAEGASVVVSAPRVAWCRPRWSPSSSNNRA